MLLAAACGKEEQSSSKQPAFDRTKFVRLGFQTALSDAELGAMAAKKGRVEATRQLGAAMQREAVELRDAFAAVAKKQSIEVPATIEPRKVALRDNLAILPGQVFDRGYSLAMVQDLRSLQRGLQQAAASGDPDLKALADRYGAILKARERNANDVLDSLGGSPFGFIP